MNIRYFIKTLGIITFLSGIITMFFNWKIGITLLIAWFFLTGSVLIWLTDDKVLHETDRKVKEAVEQTIHKGKKRAMLFAIIEAIILIIVWTR